MSVEVVVESQRQVWLYTGEIESRDHKGPTIEYLHARPRFMASRPSPANPLDSWINCRAAPLYRSLA